MAAVTMGPFLVCVGLLASVVHAAAHCHLPASEFVLHGDHLIGGLFDLYHVSSPIHHHRPEAVDCTSQNFLLPNYRRFQLMRFSVEEINNSSDLLPDVSLGYEIFDICSDLQSFPGVLKQISVDGSVQAWAGSHVSLSKVIGVVGPFSSTQTLTVAPLFMVDFISMVSYGASSSVFSSNENFPSFLRTVHPNKEVIDVIIRILQHFNWRWAAFLNSDNDFGIDGRDLFIQGIKDTEVCLAYTQNLNMLTDFTQTFRQIEQQKIGVIIVFAPKMIVEALIDSAIGLNVTNRVWIADDGWSMNKNLPKKKGIRSIGTVIGVSQPVVTIPGFDKFVFSDKSQNQCKNSEQQMFCNQFCKCSHLSAEEITSADPTFSFPVYSAVYAIAHALHRVLQCGAGSCNRSITVHPHMVLAELKKSNFTLLNQTIQFNEYGDPKFGSYSIVYWNAKGIPEEVGFFHFHPFMHFYINGTKVQWFTNGEVPTSLCSTECQEGYIKTHNGIHQCCFTCEVCPNGTYVNSTDQVSCHHCEEHQWSAAGSTSCLPRTVEYVAFTDTAAVVILVGAGLLLALTLAMCVLFAINYNTPVVRSAGGPMCFLILGCLSLCSISIFFFFDKPTVAFCVLRFLPFVLFYTVCLACFVVRSFQIVSIFKIAAKFPQAHSWWMKYHGQWLVISVTFVIQAFLIIVSLSSDPPSPFRDIVSYPDKIILGCFMNLKTSSGSTVLLLSLGSLCFIFSYMGKDLPKNYNEAKAITFCLLLLILTWIIFTTASMLYQGKYIHSLNALAVLSSIYSFLLWYFLPKCYIIIFQPQKNTQKYFQGLIQDYTKTISQ
uniref:Taste 1 receptor member 1 n=1 Tax=Takifugu rubripes TaxID=31033 RepID=A0A6D2X0F5_TAKRU